MEMCRVLNVSKSGYYNWLNNQDKELTVRAMRRKKIKTKIRKFFHESLGTYGACRVHKDLLAAGYKLSERTVGRYMKEMGLRATPLAPYTVTTDSNHELPLYDDLLKQNFEVNAPNKAWVCDITYIWTSEGWVYLAIVLDLYARKIVGWYTADHMRKELVLTALEMAVHTRQPAEGLIVHSDRGSQYASSAYRKALEAINAFGSMSRKGNPYDNACAETFFATLKKGLIYRHDFKTQNDAITAINWYISDFYNEQRRHSANAYVSPKRFEEGLDDFSALPLTSYLLAT